MKKLSIALSLILTFSLFVQNIYADENSNNGDKSSITGRVLDSSNTPLPGATLVLTESKQGVVTDHNGIYRINNITPGEYTLHVSYIGYESIDKKLSIEPSTIYTENIILKEGLKLQEVVVQGIMKEQSRALNQQKNNVNISNIVSSEQVGQFPDNNVGDALKRIPGINVQYDQGEARFGHIRGTSPEYNSVTINGERIPSAEAEIRSIQLDLVPSDMVQTIEVNKVVTPDMEADAIGGSVNLITRSNPFKEQFSARIGTGYNFLSNDPQLQLSAVYGNRLETGGNSSLGMTFSASYQDNQLGSDNIEAEWEEDDNGNLYASDFQIRTYYLQRIRQSYSASFDYEINANHKIELKGIYNRRKDWENRYRLRYKDIEGENGSWTTEVRRQTKGGTNKDGRLEDQKTMNFSLNGEHHFGSVEVNWKGSYAKASEDRPNERYISLKVKDVAINPNLSNPEKPMFTISDPQLADLSSEYGLKELTEEFQFTEDIDKNFKVDIKLPLVKGKTKLKTGFRYKSKEKNRDNQFYDIDLGDDNEDSFVNSALANQYDASKSDFMAGDYMAGHFVSKEFLSGQNFNDYDPKENLEEEAGNFEAEEKVYAGYVRVDQKIGDKLKMIFGVRMERTDLEYSGRILNIPIEDEDHPDYDEDAEITLNTTKKESNDYNNFLPSIIAKYSISENTKLKLAWTNTISRPNYYDLVPHSEIKTEDSEIEIGNPTLEPTTAMNIDVMAEHYFSNIGVISGGFFYKSLDDISNTIELRDYSYNNQIWEKFFQPINVGDADLYGFEFAFQRQLDFLPGFLNNLGVYANYTYTHSKMKNINIEGREDEDLAIAGTPENNMNISLFYESKKLSVRLSLQHADEFIDEWGKSAFYDRYYDKATHLDLSASYNINKNWSIFASANNLLNEPLRYYQGEESRTMQSEYYGVKANIGLNLTF
ncbi:TonB-dependent receptor [Marinifilum sp.]|uniref:TonB-dependent receptor n=1 Tax=Marinifilum sp. TaxID=2033137 RepID=UPI003BA8F97C